MLRRELEYFFGALRFFTRLPVPAWVGHSAEHLNRSARYFPAVGLLVGAAGALAYVLAAFFWPKTVAVLLSMAVTVYITGAFHEDGLSDTVDGFGGGWEKARVLEIMKDSRLGTYGAVALVFGLLGKFLLMVEMPEAWLPAALVAGHGVSRFAATTLLSALDYVREDALSKAKPLATRLNPPEMLLAGAFAVAGLLLLPPERALLGAAVVAAATLWLAALFRRRLGGYTGDCLGAAQQLTEIAFYLALVARLP